MNSTASHIVIAANPNSGSQSSAEQVQRLQQAVMERGFECETLHDLAAFKARCEDLHSRQQLRAAVSAGGDGTVAALANMLPASVPIQLFPLGTENLLAKQFGVTSEISRVVESIDCARQLAIDAGSANGKLFLVVASCGYDAEVVRSMHSVRRGHINRWSYAGPIWSALRKYPFPNLRYQLDVSHRDTTRQVGSASSTLGAEEQKVESAAWLFVFNAPRYAADLQFCPDADPTDGKLDVCTFRRRGIPYGLAYLTRLYFRSHRKLRDFKHQRCESLHLEAPTDPRGDPLVDIPFQLDGDPGGVLPLEIKVLPKRLTLLVPKT